MQIANVGHIVKGDIFPRTYLNTGILDHYPVMMAAVEMLYIHIEILIAPQYVLGLRS